MTFLALFLTTPVCLLGHSLAAPSGLSQEEKQKLWGHPSKPASFALAIWWGTSAAQYPEAFCWESEDPKYLKSSLLVLRRGLF